MKPFLARPFLKKNLRQFILRQEPIDNAIIELNNLLATQSLENLSKRDVQLIEKKYNIHLLSTFKLNLEQFYAVLLNYFLKYNGLTDNDAADLEKLQFILSLPDESTLKITKMLYQRTPKIVSQEGSPSQFGRTNVLPDKSSFDRKIHELISNGDIEDALTFLEEKAGCNCLFCEEITLHRAKYNDLMKKERLHLLSSNELELKLNALRQAILASSRTNFF